MRQIRVLRGFVLALIAAAIVACTPSAASVTSTDTPAPSIAATPGAATPTAVPPTPSAVPATPVAVSPANAPVVLAVSCDGVRTSIASPVIRAQADGVHIRFENTSGSAQPFTIEDIGGSDVPIGGGSFTYLFGPGRYQVSCAGDLVGFEVVDPAGFYKPAACADAGSGTTGTSDYVEGATGMRGTVLEVARRQLAGLAPGDVVEQGGYPLASSADVPSVVVVVRNGVVLAVLTYARDGHGGWLLDTMRTCAGAEVTVVS